MAIQRVYETGYSGTQASAVLWDVFGISEGECVSESFLHRAWDAVASSPNSDSVSSALIHLEIHRRS